MKNILFHVEDVSNKRFVVRHRPCSPKQTYSQRTIVLYMLHSDHRFIDYMAADLLNEDADLDIRRGDVLKADLKHYYEKLGATRRVERIEATNIVDLTQMQFA